VSSQEALSEAWYPSDYWVPEGKLSSYPVRYGDLLEAPSVDRFGRQIRTKIPKTGTSEEGVKPWFAALILSPSCELGAKAKPSSTFLVARVRNFTGFDSSDILKISTGWGGVNGKKVIAYAKFAYLAPVSYSKTHNEMMFADYSDTAWITHDEFIKLNRIAALDHDARVGLMRREIYYKYRWQMSTEEVRAAEAFRILNDQNYSGPKPSWATSD